MSQERATAERFLAALADREFVAMEALLTSGVRLRYLIPDGPGERTGAAEVASNYRAWFGDVDEWALVDAHVGEFTDRVGIRYRFRGREDAKAFIVEQQTFCLVDADGRIAAIDLLCSGFRPVAVTAEERRQRQEARREV